MPSEPPEPADYAPDRFDALRFALSTGELAAIHEAVGVLGIEHGNVLLTARDGSPWLEADIAVTPATAEPFPPGEPFRYGLRRLALWRATRAVYEVGPDGAAGDDPIPGCEGALRE